MRLFFVSWFVLVLVVHLGATSENVTLTEVAQSGKVDEAKVGEEDVPEPPPGEEPEEDKSPTRFQTTSTIRDYDSFKQKSITWNRNIVGSSTASHLVFTRSPPPKFRTNHKYYLGFGSPNYAYPCGSATNRKCRFLEHCRQPQYLNTFGSFLADACLIGNDFIGVCCENSAPLTAPTPPPQTTSPQRIGCGSGVVFTDRIVGGRPADPDEWPWMVALFDSDGDHFCGGVLITNQHVLTATHCFKFNKGVGITVRLGEYNLQRKSQSERDFKVAKVIQHENYNQLTSQNDIAILKLEQRVTFGPKYRHICLPEATPQIEGRVSTVTGWGRICSDCPQSDTLMELNVPTWNQKDCVDAYGKRRIPIVKTQLCAGYKEGGKDSCQGDSGGPLMMEFSEKWYVVGIVSFGKGCALPGFPGVYTRVSEYINWIQHHVRNS